MAVRKIREFKAYSVLLRDGGAGFRFPRRRGEPPVPAERVVDGDGFYEAPGDPRAIPDALPYDRLAAELPDRLAAAREQGVVRT